MNRTAAPRRIPKARSCDMIHNFVIERSAIKS